MPLDQVKTQVLLLHSERRTLDTLRAGFNDRYTVHCATTGTEALNTLGEIPIHVLISAADLPGMSGAEALREAKKRSPDTLGILLAGIDDDDSEALVGDKEVFQVVRGGIDGADLGKLIDDATRQMRLMALAESANDTAANVDVPMEDFPTAEHIVMETSENGSTIISDGTGRMPALDPKKVSEAVSTGASTIDVLVLTKDDEFLRTVKESTRGLHNVHYANTIAQADEAVRKQKVGVVVVDAAMVGDNVEKLTLHLRKTQSRLVAIVAGRRDDGEMLMDLINRGKVYRFLLKPVSPGRARLAIEASVKHHLEAPESAFKIVGKAKAAPKKPEAKPARVAKPAAAPVPPKAARPAPKKPKTKPKTKPAVAAKPATELPSISASISDSLGAAFDGDDSSFTETMTGIITSVGKSIKKDKSDKFEDTPSIDPTSLDGTGLEGGFGSMFTSPKILGGVAAVIVAVGAIGYFMLGGSDDPDAAEPLAGESLEQPTTNAAEPLIDAGPDVVDSRTGFDELLEEARLARDAGQLFNPPGGNAIEFYLGALAQAPDNSEVATELATVIGDALTMAETALLEGRADDAQAALERVALADAGNARLPFLTAQLGQTQLRDYIDTGRSAVRESRFEDAAAAIDSARALGITDVSEIDLLEAELSDARSAERVGDVLQSANARLESGALTSPANDNARYYYELALSNDPGNTAAQQGLIAVASKLVLAARALTDSGDFDGADRVLAEARGLDPGSAELTATSTALADARARVAEEARQQEANRIAAQRAEAERIEAERIAAQKAEADRLAKEKADRLAKEETDRLAREEADRVAREEAERIAVEQENERQATILAAAAAAAAAASTESVDAGSASTGQNAGASATDIGQQPAGFASNDAAESESSIAEPTEPVIEPPVPVSSLSRTRYVAPKYPRTAERRGLSGWVDVVFVVGLDGLVTTVDVTNSEPDDTFVESAVRAVRRWEFEPIFENGVAVEKRAAIRMMFAIE